MQLKIIKDILFVWALNLACLLTYFRQPAIILVVRNEVCYPSGFCNNFIVFVATEN